MFFFKTAVRSFFTEFWQKFLGRVVKIAFCVSRGTLWGFFSKKFNFKLTLFVWAERILTSYKVFPAGLSKLLSTFAEEHMEQQYSFLKEVILKYWLLDLEVNVSGFERKFLGRVQSYPICFLLVKNPFREFFRNIFHSFVNI